MKKPGEREHGTQDGNNETTGTKWNTSATFSLMAHGLLLRTDLL